MVCIVSLNAAYCLLGAPTWLDSLLQVHLSVYTISSATFKPGGQEQWQCTMKTN